MMEMNPFAWLTGSRMLVENGEGGPSKRRTLLLWEGEPHVGVPARSCERVDVSSSAPWE